MRKVAPCAEVDRRDLSAISSRFSGSVSEVGGLAVWLAMLGGFDGAVLCCFAGIWKLLHGDVRDTAELPYFIQIIKLSCIMPFLLIRNVAAAIAKRKKLH